MQVGNKIIFIVLLHFSLLHGKISVYFAPDDKPQKHLINYIDKAQSRIYGAIYMFTDKKIAQALINAKKRKVDVQIICDPVSFDSKYGKMKMLVQKNIKSFVFVPGKKRSSRFYGPLMHNKFAIIDNKVWTGSYNWTVSANKNHQENAICTDAKSLCEKYLEQFRILKTRCKRFKKERPTSTNTHVEQPDDTGVLTYVYSFLESVFGF
jgi:phosphatidylserine/phosphatidylglycerophosphate/cardiolipin synthase-like enzyme